VEHPQPGGLVTDSDNIFRGVIYAAHGQVMTSGSKSTIRGAIVAQGIKVNGSTELIIYDNTLFPHSTRYVDLSD
jgi:hypothetical protein